jgi:hypothetical protein
MVWSVSPAWETVELTLGDRLHLPVRGPLTLPIWVVKRKFEDQEDTERAPCHTPDADTADAAAATPATSPDARAAAAS